MAGHGLPANVRLANEIAVHFTHVPLERAAEEVATHMRLFWDPRMLTDLLARMDTPELDPIARAAAQRLRAPA